MCIRDRDEDEIRAIVTTAHEYGLKVAVHAHGAEAVSYTHLDVYKRQVLSYRRGRGVIDDRDPLSVNLPLGHELWTEADVVLAVGTHLHMPLLHWGIDRNLAIVRIDADPDEPARIAKPKVALVGSAAPILRRLLDLLPAHNARRASRTEEMLSLIHI